MKNICWKCKNWEKCFYLRYYDKQEPYMKKVTREKDEWGQDVIYVEECDEYEYEIQPDMPYLNKKESRHKIDKFVNSRIYDIIERGRNYRNDSGT